MKILAIDTSGPSCSVSIVDNQNQLADFTIQNGITHSQNLVPMIEQAQKFANVDLSEIDAFACSIGPGSFTGLRIGIATIKGFALSFHKPVLAVPTLLAMAYQASYFDGLICSVLDARNDNVYAGIYRKVPSTSNGSAFELVLVEDYISDSIEVLLQKLQQFHENMIFVGDGAEVYHDLFVQSLSSDCYSITFAPHDFHRACASSVARVAQDMASRNEFSDYHTLSPLYLKKSQAERELDQKKGQTK